jgi:hypothetical protein
MKIGHLFQYFMAVDKSYVVPSDQFLSSSALTVEEGVPYSH